MLAKAELKEYIEETDDLKVELSDSNRPDLWSAEGIARQIRIALSGKPEVYRLLQARQESHAGDQGFEGDEGRASLYRGLHGKRRAHER